MFRVEETEHVSHETLRDFATEKIRLNKEEILHIEKCTECARLFYRVMLEMMDDPS